MLYLLNVETLSVCKNKNAENDSICPPVLLWFTKTKINIKMSILLKGSNHVVSWIKVTIVVVTKSGSKMTQVVFRCPNKIRCQIWHLRFCLSSLVTTSSWGPTKQSPRVVGLSSGPGGKRELWQEILFCIMWRRWKSTSLKTGQRQSTRYIDETTLKQRIQVHKRCNMRIKVIQQVFL